MKIHENYPLVEYYSDRKPEPIPFDLDSEEIQRVGILKWLSDRKDTIWLPPCISSEHCQSMLPPQPESEK